MHPIERYVGMPYKPGEFDCADLAELVVRELFGKQIALPKDRTRPTSTLGQARQLHDLQPDVARPNWSPHAPADGDGVLLAAGQLAIHIGICCRIGPEVWVLHNDREAMQTVLTRWRDLNLYGFKPAGIYEWI